MRSGSAASSAGALERFDRRVGFVSGAVVLLLLAVSTRYGWHRDELYFLEAGEHLQWGYVDQPPFTPFVARVADIVAPGNLAVLRLLPALATGLTGVVGALVVRELGGSGHAQVSGAAVTLFGGFALGVGHLLSTATFDLLAWITALWLVIRLLRTADPRWWVAIGAVVGLSLFNKNLVVLLGVGLGVGLLAERRWDLLVSPWVGVGAAVAIAIASPNLVWQAANGWPQLDMARALSERLATENRITLLPLQILFIGPAFVFVLWGGAVWLARDATVRQYRPLVWAWPAGLLVTFVTGGRPYYVLPFTLVVLLAGVVARIAARADDRGRGIGRLVAVNAAFAIPLALPVLPLSTAPVAATVNEAVAETVGWPELVEQVAGVVADLPVDEQESVVLLSASYGEAGAIDRFGPAHGLPPAHSGHNGYADFRRPDDPAATVVAVRYPVERLAPLFEQCEQVATVDNGLDVDNEAQGQPIVVCRDLLGDWSTAWDSLRRLS